MYKNIHYEIFDRKLEGRMIGQCKAMSSETMNNRPVYTIGLGIGLLEYN